MVRYHIRLRWEGMRVRSISTHWMLVALVVGNALDEVLIQRRSVLQWLLENKGEAVDFQVQSTGVGLPAGSPFSEPERFGC